MRSWRGIQCRLYTLPLSEQDLRPGRTQVEKTSPLLPPGWTEATCRVGGLVPSATDEAEPNPDRKPPKVVSPSDPCAAGTAKANKRVQFGYGLNYLIDIENAVIVDVEATPARTYDEVAATRSMIERTDKRFGLKPKRLAADTAYGTGKFVGWLLGAGIRPHIPVWDKSAREDGTLSRSDFRWDARRGVYICPKGTPAAHEGKTLLYRASKLDCDMCPLKTRCPDNSPGRSHAMFTKMRATWHTG
jgi:Transposase DDE domain